MCQTGARPLLFFGDGKGDFAITGEVCCREAALFFVQPGIERIQDSLHELIGDGLIALVFRRQPGTQSIPFVH